MCFLNKYRKLCTLHPSDFFDFEQFELKKKKKNTVARKLNANKLIEWPHNIIYNRR